MAKTYRHSILGGTFDRFHEGHKHFLSAAIEQSEFLTIGITTPALFDHKPYSETIEDYEIRKKNVENYLNQADLEGKFNIIQLTDIYGNALTEGDLDAIFTTHHSLKNVEKINEERQKLGFPPLEIVFVEPLLDSTGEMISSSRIREEEQGSSR